MSFHTPVRRTVTPLNAEGSAVRHFHRRFLKTIAHVAAVLAVIFAIAASPATLAAQDGRITGIVFGDGAQPLPDVQVSLVGTRFGTLTNEAGRYNLIGVTPGSYTLRAQRIGYRPTEQPVSVTADGVTTLDMSLVNAPTALKNQVVVGYTTQQRRDVSDAVAGVSAEDIEDQKVATVDEALRGRVAGVQVAASGEPGRAAEVIIRGQAFTGNSAPLYVVDGMYLRQNPNLNPDDIESIEILKDASAAAQYGAQAANGVVVIRTKKGRPGSTNQVEVRSYYGYQEVPKKVEMMNTTEWAALNRMAYTNAGLTPIGGSATPPNFTTDWQDAVFQRGAIQDHNVSIGGGSESAHYMVSGGYLKQEGTIIETGFDRFSIRLNSDIKRGRVTIGENMALSRTDRRGLNDFPLIDVLRMLPTIPVRDPDNIGGYGYGDAANETFGTNPVGLQRTRDNLLRSHQIIGTAFAEVALPANFRYRFNVGLNFENFAQRDFRHQAILRLGNQLDSARLTDLSDNSTSLLYENLLMYDNSFRDAKHRISAVLGRTEQEQSFHRLSAFRQGYSLEDLKEINAGKTFGLNNAGFSTRSALQGTLFRANYALMDRYLATVSLRRDGSSRFGPSNRYANFSALSLGWVATSEPFYQRIPLLGKANYLKVRGSYGELGNQDIGDYQFEAPINTNINYQFGNTVNNGAIQLSLASPNIKWQSNKQYNFGTDWGLLGDRLTVTTDLYQATSEGLLVNAPLPWSLGASGNPVVNAGSIRNTGLEIGATHHLNYRSLRLNTGANFNKTKNRVLSLGNGGQPIMARGVSRTEVGYPIGTYYVFKTAGIFQTAAEVTAHGVQPGAQPGDVRFVDVNGDGTLDDDDRYYAGNAIPDFTYGFFFDGGVGAFDFGLNIRGSHGAEIFNVARWWTDRMDDNSNYRAGLEPWTPTNRSTTTPRAVIGPAGASNGRYNSDRWIEDGSYVRIQNLVLGYTLPGNIAEIAGMRGGRARVYMNIQNLATFSDFSNWDPETLGFGDPLARGLDDGGIYPNPRTVSFGLDLRF
jgi:TonB-linked SusC/RagA family outer membrane protein